MTITKNGIQFASSEDGSIIIATKMIDYKMCKLTLKCDGTMGDYSKKITKICSMTNDDIKLFSGIQNRQI